jgi:hypothetical protein
MEMTVANNKTGTTKQAINNRFQKRLRFKN